MTSPSRAPLRSQATAARARLLASLPVNAARCCIARCWSPRMRSHSSALLPSSAGPGTRVGRRRGSCMVTPMLHSAVVGALLGGAHILGALAVQR